MKIVWEVPVAAAISRRKTPELAFRFVRLEDAVVPDENTAFDNDSE